MEEDISKNRLIIPLTVLTFFANNFFNSSKKYQNSAYSFFNFANKFRAVELVHSFFRPAQK